MTCYDLILTSWTGEKYWSFTSECWMLRAKCFIALVWPRFDKGGREKYILDFFWKCEILVKSWKSWSIEQKFDVRIQNSRWHSFEKSCHYLIDSCYNFIFLIGPSVQGIDIIHITFQLDFNISTAWGCKKYWLAWEKNQCKGRNCLTYILFVES